MAAKKKSKKAKATKKAKVVRKTARKAAKKIARKAKKKAPARKAAKKSVKAPAKAKATKKKAPAKKKKQIVGEGDYAATRAFDRDQASFVKKNKGKIAAMGKDAEAALDGPEGDALRAAEATAAGRSRDTF